MFFGISLYCDNRRDKKTKQTKKKKKNRQFNNQQQIPQIVLKGDINVSNGNNILCLILH